jgi:hypothetical protein
MAQQSEYLNSVTKFKVNNLRAANLITEEKFFEWSSNNIYRTSYNDMYTKVGF